MHCALRLRPAPPAVLKWRQKPNKYTIKSAFASNPEMSKKTGNEWE